MPTMTLATVPQTITGPATMNIFAHTPKIMPSFLYSSAGLAIELAKPVIGTIVPAPAKLPILSKTPIAVKKVAIKISMISIHAESSVSVIFLNHLENKSITNCPKQHIKPPTQKELSSVG